MDQIVVTTTSVPAHRPMPCERRDVVSVQAVVLERSMRGDGSSKKE